MFSISTVLAAVNAAALVYWIAGYGIPALCRRRERLQREERERSKSLARKI